jgi:hypothetical protein
MLRILAACFCALFFLSLASPAEARPRAWCGWWMRQQVNVDPGPTFNLARNWARWGSNAFGPSAGVIGVEKHHVFRVISVISRGQVIAISGNDGNAVRTRVRSTSKVISWRSE